MKWAGIITILGGVAAMTVIALGAKIYRWEAFTWLSTMIVWAIAAMIYERLSNE